MKHHDEPDPDLPLIRALQQGEEKALDALIARHETPLFHYIRQRVRNEEDAREILSESFVRLYFRAKQFRPQALFKTWLYRIALNLCRDHQRAMAARKNNWMRRRAGGNAAPEQQEMLPPERETPSARLFTTEYFAQIEAAIAKLPERLKPAFTLHVFEERPQAEVARLLGVTAKAVETRVRRARRHLMEMLSRERKFPPAFTAAQPPARSSRYLQATQA